MSKTKRIFRVHYVESERGWGQNYYHKDFSTRRGAEAAVRRNHQFNERDYARTGCVPDYYIRAESIEEITVD